MTHAKFIGVLAILVILMAAPVWPQDSSFAFSVVGEDGKPYLDLKAADVRITVDKKVVELNRLALADDGSIDLLIMIDGSVSQERVLPDEVKFAGEIIDGVLRSGDRVAVAKFTGTLELAHDLSGDLAAAKRSLGLIRFVPPPGFVRGGIAVKDLPPVPPIKPSATSQISAGASAIYDLISNSITALSGVKDGSGRKAIMIISDGHDTISSTKLADVVASSQSAEVHIFAIGIADNNYGGVNENTLKKLTQPTGGIFVVPNNKMSDTSELISKLGAVLRGRYVASLALPANTSGKLRPVEVEILNPGLRKMRVVAPTKIK